MKHIRVIIQKCREDGSVSLDDGSKTIFLNTHGTNEHEVSKGLVNFLKFVKDGLNEAYEIYEDEFVRRLQSDVKRIKDSRELDEEILYKMYFTKEKIIEHSQMKRYAAVFIL